MDDEKKKERSTREVSMLRGRIAEPKQGEYNLKPRSTSTKNRGERLRSALGDMPVMITAFDGRGKIILWNRECERITGYSAAEIIANPRAMEALCPHTSYHTQRNDRGDKDHHWACDMTCKDGTVKSLLWFDLSEQFPIPGWAKWCIGFDTTYQEGMEIGDLSAKETTEEVRQLWDREKGDFFFSFLQAVIRHKAACRAPRQNERKYRSLITNIPEVVWTTDCKSNTTFISPNVEEVYGYTPEEIYKQGDRLWFGRIHPNDVRKVKKAYKALFEKTV